MFPSVSSCASTETNSGPSTNIASVGHLDAELNGTLLLCSDHSLVVQALKKIWFVDRQFASRLGLSELSRWQAYYLRPPSEILNLPFNV